MKAKSIFAVSLLVAGAAFADTTVVETEYVLGVLPVTSTNTTELILSIPWVAEGSGGAAKIAVTNLVKTAGLKDGDTLNWYDSSNKVYHQWSKNGDNWKAETSVTVGGIECETPPDAADLNRGEAIVLTRDASMSSNTVYIVGQVGTSSNVTTTVEAGETSLVAPPMVAGTDGKINLNTDINWNGTFNVDDVITTDYYKGIPIAYTNVVVNEKITWVSTVLPNSTPTIRVGRGFWYKRGTGAGNMSIKWTAPSTEN
jgi:hypothetical protein